MEVKPKLLIGLGNPDVRYKKTYHNIGYQFIDYLKSHLLNQRAAKESLVQKQFVYVKTSPYALAKPRVFMNNSGTAVKAALRYFKVKPKEMLIIHDDSDIELGKYKFSLDRGSAGHKGVESIIQTLQTKSFWRLRIGIRKNSKLRSKADELVLKEIPKAELAILKKVFKKITEEFPSR